MAMSYPDIIGEYVTAPNRYEVDGLQYIGEIEPATIPMGETSNLVLYLQNTLGVPLQIGIKVDIPQTSRFRGKPLLAVANEQIDLQMDVAEVGYLIIPFTTTEHVSPGGYELGVEFNINHQKTADRIREPKKKNPFQGLPFDEVAGLNLVGVLGVTYNIQKGKKSAFAFTVSSEGQAKPATNVEGHQYNKIWDVDTSDSQHKAQIEINDNRLTILDSLKIEPLFAAFYMENHLRFLDVGIALEVGEAIALAKLLTFTAQLFLSKVQWQDGLLCPIWERALINDYPTNEPLKVLRIVGYKHILQLTIALSFSFIARQYGQHPWAQEEREAVLAHVVDALEEGEALEADFFYLPLMMGALTVIRQVQLPDEDINETMASIQEAYQNREDLFLDEEMTLAKKVFTTLLQKAASG